MNMRGALAGMLALAIWATSGGSVSAQTETAPAQPPLKIKMGIEVNTPSGPALLAGFRATGPIATLRQIEERMKELNCPPVMITENDNESKIMAPYAETCDEVRTVDFTAQIDHGLYPELTFIDVMVLPAAERK